VKKKQLIALIAALALFIAFFILVYQPYARQQSGITKQADDLKPSENLREPSSQVPPFALTNQYGKTFTEKDVDGKVFVADFFFTSCGAICPMMSTQLSRVQEAMGNEDRYRILSYSLDPENDSVPVLRSFARKFGARDSIWYLMTGDKKTIYKLGREGYMQSVLKDSNDVINHSPRFVLVDENRMIRGFYNGLDSLEVDMLINDMSYLIYKKQ
jgi:protein SCO1